jgi:hypothetical protein
MSLAIGARLGSHSFMGDAEGRGDGAALPVLGVIGPPNLGVLLGRDPGVSPPKTRDESARAVEGAGRFPGHRPYNATRSPEARSAPNPSSCPLAVWRERLRAGKSDASLERGTRVDGDNDRGVLRDFVDDAYERRALSLGARSRDTPASSRRGRDRTSHRWRRRDCSADRPSGEAAGPRRRRGGTLRLDTAANRGTRRRLARSGEASRRSRGSGGISSRPSSRLTASPSD